MYITSIISNFQCTAAQAKLNTSPSVVQWSPPPYTWHRKVWWRQGNRSRTVASVRSARADTVHVLQSSQLPTGGIGFNFMKTDNGMWSCPYLGFNVEFFAGISQQLNCFCVGNSLERCNQVRCHQHLTSDWHKIPKVDQQLFHTRNRKTETGSLLRIFCLFGEQVQVFCIFPLNCSHSGRDEAFYQLHQRLKPSARVSGSHSFCFHHVELGQVSPTVRFLRSESWAERVHRGHPTALLHAP